jgi:hypothetical protein
MISKNVYPFRFKLSLFQMKLSPKSGRKGEISTAVLTAVDISCLLQYAGSHLKYI